MVSSGAVQGDIPMATAWQPRRVLHGAPRPIREPRRYHTPMPTNNRPVIDLSPGCKQQLEAWIAQEMPSHDTIDAQALKATLDRLNTATQLDPPVTPAQWHTFIHQLRQHLATFVSQSNVWLASNPNQSLQSLFPNWATQQDALYELMRYTKIHQDLIEPSLPPRTLDLHQDLQVVHQFLEDQVELYGTHLATHGAQWRAIGLPVHDDAMNSAANGFINICADLVDEIYHGLAQVGDTDRKMECISMAFECLVCTRQLVDTTLPADLLRPCVQWLTIYAQWTVQQMDTTPQHHRTRSDIRISHLIGNMTRLLVCCHTLFQAESTTDTPALIDVAHSTALASSLVDLAFHVVALVAQHSSPQHQSYIKRSNIMRSSSFAVLYLEQSLFAFAASAIALYALMKNSNKAYQQKMQYLLHLIQDD
ncbi:hypothetical protein BC940DRAFT_318698 [Gongronella butleri]|nr:hypothetical protein BC940DRAFT_318698 [Gongronella butleri]